ncbi:hypothetical protein AAWM_06700 [Aspergillus awamori]|uniref:Uncharacterized protein n=3 Tax=Aspergillus TaxID=5052 RepID=A0A401KX17_ASPAW|nr:hypothetical protein ASPNIDRAFT_44126 [Aspergillus niger ATCC 1015]KAI2865720.1 hypothetical protein CBS13152_11034 [Aspergillus niger]GCB23815.1 hypothetical protein AAWM_06700 [Aspergillus awamori]KAI2924936.1 hypothetical protein CBS63078_2466 [Aspergillus niger]KAI3002111.1 hypothetical protein CBS147345_8460 [Aspergillus niger]
MSALKPNQPESLMGLSMAEARMIILGVLSSDKSGKVDFDKMAVKGGYKNAQSASTLYHKAKRRLLDIHTNPADQEAGASVTPSKEPASTTATPKKTPAKRGKDKAAADDDNTGATENTPTPSKGKRQKTAATPKTPRSATKATKTEAFKPGDATTPTPAKGKVAVKKEEPDTELETTPVKEESKSDDEELMSTSQISAEFSAMEQHPETPK